MKSEVHKQFRERIPFLKLIPDEIYFLLDTSEWLLPTNCIEAQRRELEESTGHYVMTYKPDVFRKDVPLNQHLCANFAGAKLSGNNMKVLHQAEKNAGVSFIVYQKPLKNISPVNSPLAIAYA